MFFKCQSVFVLDEKLQSNIRMVSSEPPLEILCVRCALLFCGGSICRVRTAGMGVFLLFLSGPAQFVEEKSSPASCCTCFDSKHGNFPADGGAERRWCVNK